MTTSNYRGDYRDRAEELRRNADEMRSAECAQRLRSLAIDYDRMAERRESADRQAQEEKKDA